MIPALQPGTQTGDAARIIGEQRSQRLVTAFVISGLAFMLLPGTFLGVWNLLDISQAISRNRFPRHGFRLMGRRRSSAG